MGKMEEEGNEEISVKLQRGSGAAAAGDHSRWVDGTAMGFDPAAPPVSQHESIQEENEEEEEEDNEEEEQEEVRSTSSGSLRRRLIMKKPKRLDSFDVEAMEIATSHSHHSKVIQIAFINPIGCCLHDIYILLIKDYVFDESGNLNLAHCCFGIPNTWCGVW